MIEKNATPPKSQASQVIREGSALLQGLAVCGKCGRNMHVTYHHQGKKAYPYYVCNMAGRNFGASYCQSIGGRRIDQAVSDSFLEAVSPASMGIQLQALQQVQEQQDMALEQLRLQLERAEYEANRNFRQFDAVEPENRLVARNLERQWNDSLKQVEELKTRLSDRKKQFKDRLSKIEEQDTTLSKTKRRKHKSLHSPAGWGYPSGQPAHDPFLAQRRFHKR